MIKVKNTYLYNNDDHKNLCRSNVNSVRALTQMRN
jgi:hypothetical protein